MLGVAGALIAAFLWARWPRWSSRALTYWAERSETSARRRVATLKLELEFIDGFRSEPTRYAGWLVRHVNALLVCLFFFLLAVTGLMLGVLGLIEAEILTKLGGSSEATGVTRQLLTFQTLFLIGALAVTFFTAMAFSQRLSRYADLGRRRTFIEEQIARLDRRLQARLLD